MTGTSAHDGAEHVLSLIDDIYEAAIAPDRWPVFLRRFAAAYPEGQGALYSMEGERASVILANWDDKWTRAHNEYFFDTNPWLDGMRNRRAGATNAAEDFMPLREFERTEYYNDFLRPQGLSTGVGATIARDRNRMVGLSVLFNNGREDGASRDQVAKLKLLVPHLQRAIRINRIVGQNSLTRTSAEVILDGLRVAVIVAGSSGQCLFVNKASEQVLRSGQGISVGTGQKISLGQPRLNAELAKLINLAADPGSTSPAGGTLNLPRPEGPDLMLLVAPLRTLPDVFGFKDGAALVFVVDPATELSLDETIVSSMLRLSPQQSRVACLLAAGRRVAEIAADLRVSEATIRFHLAAIFARTSTRRQSDLVRLVMTVCGLPV